MLELDLLFRPFVEECFVHLSDELQLALDELLQCEDFELLELTRQPERIPAYSNLIRMVLKFQKSDKIVDSDPVLK